MNFHDVINDPRWDADPVALWEEIYEKLGYDDARRVWNEACRECDSNAFEDEPQAFIKGERVYTQAEWDNVIARANRAEAALAETRINLAETRSILLKVTDDRRLKTTEDERDALRAGLRLAYPYMKDALETGGMTEPVEAIMREDIAIVAALLRSGSNRGD